MDKCHLSNITKLKTENPDSKPLLDKLQTNFVFVLVSQGGWLLVLTFLPFMLCTQACLAFS
jgi:hypothetical protein